MNRDLENRIEDRLMQYPLLRPALEELRMDIIQSSPASQTGPVNHAVSDPTGGRAATICDHPDCMEVEKRVRQINDCLSVMTEEQRLIVDIRYFRRASMQEAADAVPCSLSEAYRQRRDILEIVAARLGWVS